jgi:anti-sigma B factor antagonist
MESHEMDFRVTVTEQANAIVVRLAGELDMATSPRALEAVGATDLTAAHLLVVDLSDVTFCDSSGLRLLLHLRQVMVDHGGGFDAVGAHGIVASTIEVTGLTEVLHELPAQGTAEENSQH